jgi:hypothetical protein
VLAVHEVEDDPLVFTVRRRWLLGRWREVCDADGNLVGILRGAVVENVYRRVIALRGADGPGERVFRSPGGHELARLTQANDRVCLLFISDLEDPFTRMLLLAAALVDC